MWGGEEGWGGGGLHTGGLLHSPLLPSPPPPQWLCGQWGLGQGRRAPPVGLTWKVILAGNSVAALLAYSLLELCACAVLCAYLQAARASTPPSTQPR